MHIIFKENLKFRELEDVKTTIAATLKGPYQKDKETVKNWFYTDDDQGPYSRQYLESRERDPNEKVRVEDFSSYKHLKERLGLTEEDIRTHSKISLETYFKQKNIKLVEPVDKSDPDYNYDAYLQDEEVVSP